MGAMGRSGQSGCRILHPTRRDVLSGLGTIGCSALASTSVLARASRKTEVVDVHHHILPPSYMAAARERIIEQYQGTLPRAVAGWSPALALEEMDRHGIATAVVSISTPGIWFGDKEEGRRLARLCNDYSASLVREHRRRFGFFASVPLPDTEGSLREIEYALGVLGADGICLFTSYGDKWPGDPLFAPVLEELNRRHAVVYFHPTGPDCCRDLIPWVPYVVTELPHDTTRAITSLLFSGSLPRLQNISFIFSHAGGTMPMLAGRIARAAKTRPEIAEKLPNGAERELRRLHYEIGATANRPAIAALTSLVPTSQILFGTDFPYAPVEFSTEGLRNIGFSPEQVRAVGRGNALRLMPKLRPELSEPPG